MIAQKKLEQKVMNVMPLFLLFYLDITSPGYLNVLYHNVLGGYLHDNLSAGIYRICPAFRKDGKN